MIGALAARKKPKSWLKMPGSQLKEKMFKCLTFVSCLTFNNATRFFKHSMKVTIIKEVIPENVLKIGWRISCFKVLITRVLTSVYFCKIQVTSCFSILPNTSGRMLSVFICRLTPGRISTSWTWPTCLKIEKKCGLNTVLRTCNIIIIFIIVIIILRKCHNRGHTCTAHVYIYVVWRLRVKGMSVLNRLHG